MSDTRKATQKEVRKALTLAARRLEANDDWQLVKAKLFQLAPPGADCFIAADGYNTHAAAKRSGGQQLTRYLEDLLLAAIPEDETPPPKAEYVGA